MKLFLRSMVNVGVAAVVLAIPAIALAGLFLNNSRQTPVVMESSHDPLVQVANVVDSFTPAPQRTDSQTSAVESDRSAEGRWYHTDIIVTVKRR